MTRARYLLTKWIYLQWSFVLFVGSFQMSVGFCKNSVIASKNHEQGDNQYCYMVNKTWQIWQQTIEGCSGDKS